jgi:ribonuclease P protein component
MRDVRFRYQKADRLLKRSEFVLLSRCGKKIHSASFLALYQPGTSGRSRLGITVTKKVAHAPERNRLKRLVRESFRRQRSALKGCWDINIVAKQRSKGIPSLEAFAELNGIFEKIPRIDDDQKDLRSAVAHRH